LERPGSARRKLFANELEVRLARLQEPAELLERPRDEQKMRRGVKERLGPGEELYRLLVVARIERVSAGVGRFACGRPLACPGRQSDGARADEEETSQERPARSTNGHGPGRYPTPSGRARPRIPLGLTRGPGVLGCTLRSVGARSARRR